MSDKRSYQFQVLKDNWALTRAYPSTESEGGFQGETETPKLDLYETDKDIIAEVDLPGLDPRRIGVKVLDNRLILEGKQGAQPEPGNYLRMERFQEDFRRIVLLPCAVDPQHAQARYEKGVLILILPKIDDRRQRAVKIPIK